MGMGWGRQEAGGRRQEAGGRRQEAGGRRQEAGGRGVFQVQNIPEKIKQISVLR